MYKIKFTLILFLFFMIYGSSTHAQWVQTNGPYSPYTGTIISFAVSGTNIFAGGGSGVFLSTNNGMRWSAAGLTNSWVSALEVRGTNLFAGTWGGGVWRLPIIVRDNH